MKTASHVNIGRMPPWLPTAVLLLGVALFNFAWMPGELMRGDPMAWREEARSLLLRGGLSVPADIAHEFGEPGQYFVHNERDGLHYSKYGVMNSIVSLPALWLQQHLGGGTFRRDPRNFLLIANLWNIALSVVLAALLWRLARAYSRRPWLCALFVLAELYCTSLWYYLRAQSSEIVQLVLFTAMFLCLRSFLGSLRSSGPARLAARDWATLAAVWLLASALLLTRVVYGLLLPLVALLIAWVANSGSFRSASRTDWMRLGGATVAPPLCAIALLAWIDWAKFGSPWLTGYHQWHAELHLPTGSLAEGVTGFLFAPRFSVFLCFPLLIFAIAGFGKFSRLHRIDAAAIFVIFTAFLLAIGKTPIWAGEWTYGPRYLLFVLPVLSAPFLDFADSVVNCIDTWWARGVALVVVAVLGFSAYLQVQVNRLPFFIYYEAAEVLTVDASESTRSYFEDRPVGLLCLDLLRHRDDLDALPYFASFERSAAAQVVNRYRAVLRNLIEGGNWYWGRP